MSNYMMCNKERVNCCYSAFFNNPKRNSHLFFQLSNNPNCPVSVGDCYKCNEIDSCGCLPVSSAAKLLPGTCDMSELSASWILLGQSSGVWFLLVLQLLGVVIYIF